MNAIDQAKIEGLTEFDPTDYLQTEEAIQAFLDEFADATEEEKAHGQQVVAKARARYNLPEAQ